MTESVEAQVSEPDKSYRWDLRIGVVVGAMGFLAAQWLLFIKGPGKGDSHLDGVLLELLACAFLGVPLLMWRNRKRHAIGFDADGLWLLHIGKQRGLVPWGRVESIRESGAWCRMSLRGRGGERLIDVEYQRTHFQEIRGLIMQGMSFRPPLLPRVFPPGIGLRIGMAVLAALAGGLGLLFVMNPDNESGPFMTIARYLLGPLFAAGALLFAAVAITSPKIVVERDGVRRGRRRFPFSETESVSMSFWRQRGAMYPWVWITLKNGKRQVLPQGAADSLTFQRTLQWALDRWREENASVEAQQVAADAVLPSNTGARQLS